MVAKNRKNFFPIILIFIISTALFIIGKSLLDRWGMDRDVLLIGNIILADVTLLSYFMAQKGLKSSNPHAFVRSINSSMLLKLFIVIVAAFIYIASADNNVNKPALFTLMGLYLVYTFVEVGLLTRLLKQKKNG